MSETIEVEVSDLHAEMYRRVSQAAEDDVRSSIEDTLNQLYKNFERVKEQQVQIESPEERDDS